MHMFEHASHITMNFCRRLYARPHTEPRFELQSAHPAAPCCPFVRPTPLVNHPPFSCNFMLNFRPTVCPSPRVPLFPRMHYTSYFPSLFFIHFLFFFSCRTSGAALHRASADLLLLPFPRFVRATSFYLRFCF